MARFRRVPRGQNPRDLDGTEDTPLANSPGTSEAEVIQPNPAERPAQPAVTVAAAARPGQDSRSDTGLIDTGDDRKPAAIRGQMAAGEKGSLWPGQQRRMIQTKINDAFGTAKREPGKDSERSIPRPDDDRKRPANPAFSSGKSSEDAIDLTVQDSAEGRAVRQRMAGTMQENEINSASAAAGPEIRRASPALTSGRTAAEAIDLSSEGDSESEHRFHARDRGRSSRGR